MSFHPVTGARSGNRCLFLSEAPSSWAHRPQQLSGRGIGQQPRGIHAVLGCTCPSELMGYQSRGVCCPPLPILQRNLKVSED